MKRVLKHAPHSLKQGQRGLTLIEVLVVLVILGIIAALVVPNVMGRADKAKVDATKLSLKAVAGELNNYKLDNNQYPSMEDGGLNALVSQPANAKNWPANGYFQNKQLPKDAWGNEFQYSIPGTENREFDLFSFGADGKQGGEENNKDIYYQ